MFPGVGALIGLVCATGLQTAAPADCGAATPIGTFERPRRPKVVVRYVPALQGADGGALVYEAGLSVDADGGPHAYRDDDKGLDTIRNACPADRTANRCFGILETAPGHPVRQRPPNQAYFVSPTTLGDRSKAATDQARYVDAESIAYLALPKPTLVRMAAAKGVGPLPLALGDLAFVRDRKTGKSAFAIFADVGPARKIGEGSIALAQALGLPSNPRHGGATGNVQVVVLVGSGDGRPRPQAEIDRAGRAAFDRWGGERRLDACGDEAR